MSGNWAAKQKNNNIKSEGATNKLINKRVDFGAMSDSELEVTFHVFLFSLIIYIPYFLDHRTKNILSLDASIINVLLNYRLTVAENGILAVSAMMKFPITISLGEILLIN